MPLRSIPLDVAPHGMNIYAKRPLQICLLLLSCPYDLPALATARLHQVRRLDGPDRLESEQLGVPEPRPDQRHPPGLAVAALPLGTLAM